MVELIIVLLIGALLMAWGVPNYRDLKADKQLADNANEISYSLALARAEAVRYGRVVTVTPEGGDWNDGWTISTTGIDGGGDIQIYKQDPLNDSITISQDGALQGNLQFNNLGGLVGVDEGLFGLSNYGSADTKVIRVKLTGVARVEDGP